jgi:large subunit ribosomal protein L25
MVEIQATKRDIVGKKVRSLRVQDQIPAELYGHGFENIHLQVPVGVFSKILSQTGESSIVNLIADGQKYPALIHSVQRDFLGDRIIHVDFYRVRMDEKITTHVPVVFINEAPAVKEKGGVLVKSLEHLEVRALPAHLPHNVEADLSLLAELHASLHVKDIAIPAGIEVLTPPETTVATITEPRKEKEEVPLAPVEEVAAQTEALPETEQVQGKEEKKKEKEKKT